MLAWRREKYILFYYFRAFKIKIVTVDDAVVKRIKIMYR